MASRHFSYRRSFPAPPGDVGTLLSDVLLAFGPVIGLSPEDLAFFGARFWQILTSCEERRIGEYERVSWWEFIDAEPRSASYQKFLATGFTRSLVASKARKASARTVGDMFMQMMLTFLDPTSGSTDRLLDGPTNLVWIDPWCSYLESRGVQYVRESEVVEILCDSQRVTGVAVRRQGQRTLVEGDYYVAAIPLERIAALINERMLAIDPALGNLSTLAPNVEWMNGLQFYLRRDLPIAHGHVIHIDSEWALTSVSQIQFWRSMSPDQFGDSDVRGVLSVDISNWEAPGLNGRSAMQCSREEVMREVWAQLKRSINIDREVLRDEDLHSWFLDPDIQPSGRRLRAADQCRAVTREPGQHVGAASRCDHADSESVFGVRLCSHLHRPRDDGRGQRSGAPRGQRPARRNGFCRAALRRLAAASARNSCAVAAARRRPLRGWSALGR